MTYSYRIGHEVEDHDLDDGMYGSHWGLSDLYKRGDDSLHRLLKSHDDFHAHWGCKHELLSAELLRVDGTLTITAHAWMDDLWDEGDLIVDAYYEATGDSECEIPDSLFEAIRDSALEADVDDNASATWSGACPSYAKIMSLLDDLSTEAEEKCQTMYQTLVDIVKDLVHYYWD